MGPCAHAPTHAHAHAHARTTHEHFCLLLQDWLADDVTVIAASKGLEETTALMMSEIIPEALGRKQPAVFISGPSFAAEIVRNNPTALVAASTVSDRSHTAACCAACCILLELHRHTSLGSSDRRGIELLEICPVSVCNFNLR